jgi:hypothetical protein
MTNEIKSGGKVIATITQRQVVAFQINIHSTSDAKSVDVPVWANTIAVDEDGAIWAYESVAEDVRIVCEEHKAWSDWGKVEANMQEIGEMPCVPDWTEAKIDLRAMK